MIARSLVLSMLAAGGAGLLSGPSAAQEADGWNSSRARALYERARDRRALPHADSTLENYAAHASGWVYFYLDRQDGSEPTLVKVDQVALNLYWAAPNRTKQQIVGLRDESVLPNRMHYHLDHLTVVLDEFGDAIRLGDGDEVRDVPHPAAPGADAIYDYRLADSLTLRLPGAPEPVRVYELEVRPRRTDRPAFVGSLYLDRASADIVRMTFTFTPASYVDPRLDYIRISLDNGLWSGRYWLPHEQRVQIRRQIPELDFPAGGVIRGVMRIGDYRFNEPLPDGLFRGPTVTALPRSARESYPFEDSLFAGLADEGLSPAADFAALRRQASELVRDRYLSGLPRLRLRLPDASSALRYDRAEGLYLGMGASYAASAATRLEALAGYAMAADRATLAAGLVVQSGERGTVRLRAYDDELRDLGPFPGAARAFNTLAALFAGSDYLDPYYATGGAVEAELRFGRGWQAEASAALERHTSGGLAVDEAPFGGEFRPVRPVEASDFLTARAGLSRALDGAGARDWGVRLELEGGGREVEAAGSEMYLRPVGEAAIAMRSLDRRTSLRADAAAGLVLGRAPVQRLFYLGGRATLPGHGYRAFAGESFALGRLELARDLAAPWLRLRASAALGWTGTPDAAGTLAPAAPSLRSTDGVRASLGVGVGLVHDILRVEIARGLNGGSWRGIVSIDPALWGIL